MSSGIEYEIVECPDCGIECRKYKDENHFFCIECEKIIDEVNNEP